MPFYSIPSIQNNLLLLFLFVRFKIERRGVHAIALARQRGAVVEEVAEVGAAAGADDLGADHAVGGVFDLQDLVAREFFVKAGPSAFGIKLHVGGEQFGATAGAGVDSFFVVQVIFAHVGGVGSLFTQHVVLFGGEDRAPFGIRALDHLGRVFCDLFLFDAVLTIARTGGEQGDGYYENKSLHGILVYDQKTLFRSFWFAGNCRATYIPLQ